MHIEIDNYEMRGCPWDNYMYMVFVYAVPVWRSMQSIR